MIEPLKPAMTDRHKWVLVILWVAALLLVTISWVHVFNLEKESSAREFESAERELSNLTRVSQEHANRTFRSADQVIQFIRTRYLETGSKLDLASLSEKGVIDTEIFNQVGIIDADGIYALSNLPIKTRMDLSDRQHFKVHIASSSDELYVSQPILGRASGKWSIQLTRKITGPGGEFAGVVVVSVDPGYFTRFYSELTLGSQGLTALYGLDGVARARKVGNKEDFGANASNSPMFDRIASGELTGSYVQHSIVDGVERLFYYRKIPGYKLAVVAGVDVDYLLNNHRKDREALYLQAGIVSVLVLILAASLHRYLARVRKESAARQLAQLQIEERTEQLNAIFVLSPDGFVSFDRDHRIRYVSPAFARMVAIEAGSLEGLDENDFSAWLAGRCEKANAFMGIAALRNRSSSKDSGVQQVIEIDQFGKRQIQVGYRKSESSAVSQILYFRDVTHEYAVDRMKSDFLSTAAHELRTPMASIYGFSEVLLTLENDPASQREFLGIIHKQSQIMVKILDELLDLARIEARRGADFKFQKLCVQKLFEEIFLAFKAPEGRSVPIVVRPEEPVYVRADQGKMRQVMLNVLVNAYKFSPGGGPVTVRLSQTEGSSSRLCITVEDQGIGMTQDELSKVFTRFYRADASGSVPGTGLGMSIVKEIVELHGGEISIDSEPGRGTVVAMYFPCFDEPVVSNSTAPAPLV